MKKKFLYTALAILTISSFSGCATFNNDNYDDIALLVVEGNECFRNSWVVSNNGACTPTLVQDNQGRQIDMLVDMKTDSGKWIVMRCGFATGWERCKEWPRTKSLAQVQSLWSAGSNLPQGVEPANQKSFWE